jgi:hypothetical protein
MFKVTIPTPCHEDWQQMLPTEKGAYCGVCSKEVIDFSTMSDEAVKHYLLNRRSEKLCGKFRKEQVEAIKIYLPKNILTRQMAGWKKFMAIVLLVFSSTLIGCDVLLHQVIKGEPIVGKAVNARTSDSIHMTTGFIMPVIDNNPLLNSTKCDTETKGETSFFIEADTTTAKINFILDTSHLTGEIFIDTIVKTTADTIPVMKKNPADTSDCGTQNYY